MEKNLQGSSIAGWRKRGAPFKKKKQSREFFQIASQPDILSHPRKKLCINE